jgi:CheY-like chemotaxis protein
MALILTVDDEPDVLTLIETTLEMAGHDVVTATNGEEALTKVRKRAFDLIILDIMMPKLSGYEVLDQIREMPSRADTPVIVVTAKHDPEGVAREVKGGAVDHLAKPFLPTELLEAVARALEGDVAATEERRRVLSHEADVYGSMQELYKDVRENPESEFRKRK